MNTLSVLICYLTVKVVKVIRSSAVQILIMMTTVMRTHDCDCTAQSCMTK